MNKLIEKLNFTKKRIEDVEEENRELSSTYENINQNIKNEEKKIYQYNKLSVQL